jgi:hypothetical protein
MSGISWCQSALLLATAGSAAAWLAGGFSCYRGSIRVRGLGSVRPRPDADLPSLTVVMAAKDEAARVGDAARTLLAQDYPNLQLIAVDDRSEDETGAILDRIASADPRLDVVHVTELPQGWLGKCHALSRGAAAATGDWILFTDGDVLLAPEAARQAVSFALDRGADHVAVAPDLEVQGLGEAIFVGYFVSIFNVSQRPWDAPNPRSKAHVGIGAFNLVRAEAYARSGGHDRLRMELVDDMALGLILKESGACSHFAGHDGLLRARWHVGVGGLVRGVEKNAFPSLGYRVGATIAAVGLQIVWSLAPLVGLFASDSWTRAAAVLAWSGVALVYSVTARTTRIHLWQAILMPVGAILFAYAILASMVATLRRGGVVWRGTFYPIAMLKAGRVR